MMPVFDRWRRRARRLKTELAALRHALADPRTPWRARVVVALVVAYAFSPIDLIPDPIPILGYLDDLVLLPLGIALALRLIPPEVRTESRRRAVEAPTGRPTGANVAAVLIVVLWLLTAWTMWRFAWQLFRT